MRRAPFAPLLVMLIGTSAFGQSRDTQRWLDDCRRGRWNGDRDREQYCDVREQTISARSQLRVDGRENGGIDVIGSDRSDILVIAKIQARAESQSDAKNIADQIKIDTGDEIRADGPSTRWRSSWSVSYELHVPRRMNLDLTANNGGISIENVDGRMEFETTNGGISLTGVAGNVRGSTSNGGVEVELTGDRWSGDGLDVRTTNGGVEMRIPANYNARLETGTVNGGMDVGFPITIQGRLDRRLTTQLGSGGPLVRVTTTNGGVTLRRR
jgi:Putative adhesin